MDELFDVFDDQPAKAGQPPSSAKAPLSEKPGKVENRRERKPHKKRKAREALGNGNGATDANEEASATHDVHMIGALSIAHEGNTNSEGSDSEQEVKRRRKGGVAEPVLTDTFETATSRELAAADGFATSRDDPTMLVQHNIRHQVALPPDMDQEYVPLSEHKPPDVPAREWPFVLDHFQRFSISSIERDESVLVAAHTSAGKTVVAEYAIAQCLKRNSRVIYTSPIKALSNQKYREFNEAFGDVGLMTGDVTINPTASCLVMTTEILRSMLYRGSEIMREVAWVVFDEVHYMREKVRGVVWEETIILLPDKVRFVFLSATIPNAFQFAEWIAKIKRQACHVVYTDFRPTPLQNYMFPSGNDGIFLVVDEKNVFRENNFNKTMQLIEEKKGAVSTEIDAKTRGKGKHKHVVKGGANDSPADIEKIVRMIMRKNFNPVIVFSFSKKECEKLAIDTSKFTFNVDSEKMMVRRVFNNAIDGLAEEDRQLPQIQNILPLLEMGIGVHHSGLLPILKETIEILFQEGLIKVLFATETFSIGLNMPAKTVVFTSVKKFDGTTTRPISSSEYVQMAGRAGRRGLDARGIVIMMIDDKLDPDVAREIMTGAQTRLDSAFHISYNMLLNLLRIEGVKPEDMLENCFFQFQNSASVGELEREVRKLQKQKEDMVIPDESTVKDYYTRRRKIEDYTKDMAHVMQHPNYCLEFLQPGRLVHITDPRDDKKDFGWGIIASVKKRKAPKPNEEQFPPQESYVVDVFLRIDPDSEPFVPLTTPSAIMPPGTQPHDDASVKAKFEAVPCLLTCVRSFSQIRVFMPKMVKSRGDVDEVRQTLYNHLAEVERRFPDGVPILDPVENMGIKDASFKDLLIKIELLEARLLTNPLHNSPLLPGLYEQYKVKLALAEKIKDYKKKIAKAHQIAQLDELKARKRVLRRLDFIDDADVVQMKARVACEISSTEGHELLLAELLFNRFFNELTPEITASIVSVFIFDEKQDATPLKEELAKPYAQVQAQARTIAKVSQESKIDVNEEEYVQSLKWQLMETVHAWAQGKPFGEVCKMTTAFEGSLIRLFRRLEELLRQLATASKVMGSEELMSKFEQALAKVRRDIVAAQSLYL